MLNRLIPLLAAVAFALLVAMAGPIARVYACRCVELQPAQALARADVAFAGVVAGVRDPLVGNPMISRWNPVTYTFVVDEVIMGGASLGDAIEVLSARDEASCGQTFTIGQRWRLYAYRDGPGLSTGLCSGNELLAERVPIPPVGETDPGPPPIGLLIAIGACGVVAVVSIFALRPARPEPIGLGEQAEEEAEEEGQCHRREEGCGAQERRPAGTA